MIFNIDFSIFLASGESFGQISGKIESQANPVPGMSIAFIFPLRKTEISPFSHWELRQNQPNLLSKVKVQLLLPAW